ncbi:MAG: hypothetical protein BGO23_12695 [Solirubrobacterales bacterium 67-14]|nr:MAG: hypothetical protein BGO23_12695 [Solirubrobacterales bacterium 67-14]
MVAAAEESGWALDAGEVETPAASTPRVRIAAVIAFIRGGVAQAGLWVLSQARRPVAVAPAATTPVVTHCMHMS